MKTIIKSKKLWFAVIVLLLIVIGIFTTIRIIRKNNEQSMSDHLSLDDKANDDEPIITEGPTMTEGLTVSDASTDAGTVTPAITPTFSPTLAPTVTPSITEAVTPTSTPSRTDTPTPLPDLPLDAEFDDNTVIRWIEPIIEEHVRNILDKPVGEIKVGDLDEITSLGLVVENINRINDLRYFKNLEYLDLDGNHITDISSLEGLTKIKTLILDNNWCHRYKCPEKLN